jgi:hypothetical protein
VADLPFDPANTELAGRLLRSLDVEGKIPRALEALGPVGGRDVVLLGGGSARAQQLRELGARVTEVDSWAGSGDLPDGSADVIVAYWSGFRGGVGASGPADVAASGPAGVAESGLAGVAASGPADPRLDELRQAERLLRHAGRLLIVHDYGRDDVSGLRGDLPEYRTWSRRDGWFLKTGFRIRVVHTFWTFDTMDDIRTFVDEAFGSVGSAIVASLNRPRLTYNVAVYHRIKGGA